MSKWFEVTVISSKTFAIEVEDDGDSDKAQQYAMDEIMSDGNSEVHECCEVKGAQVESLKRHADEVFSL